MFRNWLFLSRECRSRLSRPLIIARWIEPTMLVDLFAPTLPRWPYRRCGARMMTWMVGSAMCLIGLSTTDNVAQDAPADSETTTVIRASHVYVGDGEVLNDVDVLIRGGKIAVIANHIVVPIGASLVEVDTVVPGLVNASSDAGLRGGRSERTREVTPEFQTVDAIDWSSRDFAEIIARGETTVNVMPSTDNVFGGMSCIIKTSGSPAMRVVDRRSGLAIAMCSDPAGGNRSRTRPDSIYVRQPTNRMGVVWILRDRFHQALQVTTAAEIGDADTDESAFVMDADEQATRLATNRLLADALRQDVRLFGVSRTKFDIETLFTLADEFQLSPVLVGGDEAYKVVDLLQKRGQPVVYTAATDGALFGQERTDLVWSTPRILAEAGIDVVLAGDDLIGRARFAVRNGMARGDALRAITGSPAKLLGIDDRVGTIGVDRDADLVVMTGDPLEPTSAVSAVMVDGAWVTAGPLTPPKPTEL